jgi:hypothetical protein
VLDVRGILDSLPDDLKEWRRATANKPLDKHASQVEAIVGQLSAALAELRLPPDDGGSASEVIQAVLDYHHIWDFFRAKLALRFVPWYQPFLAAADDLAWASWRPVRDAVRARTGREIREPPLVYLSRSAIPFAVNRGDDYRDLLPRGGIWTTEAERAASALVVPVISLPWHRTNWLPVILSIAHEVGHVVVADLALLPSLTDRLGAIDLHDRHEAWTSWLEEVYADVFAAVVCGGGTELSLVGQLGADDGGPPPEPPWGDYPPVPLRAHVIREVARRRGGSVQAAPPGGFTGDVPAVVAALLDQDLPDAGRLDDLFSPVDTPAMRDEADRLARARNPQAADVRSLLAAATRALAAAPDTLDRTRLQRAVLERAARIRDVGRRGRSADTATASAERDRAAGVYLASILRPTIG